MKDISKHLELFQRVEDGLPEDDHTYLCLNNGVEYMLCYRHKYCTKGYWNVVNSRDGEINTITHWLNLDNLIKINP